MLLKKYSLFKRMLYDHAEIYPVIKDNPTLHFLYFLKCG